MSVAKKQLFSEFNQRIQFGDIESVANDNTGDYDESFVSKFALWCKPQKRTTNQAYSIYGTSLDGTIVVVVRHDGRLSTQIKAQYKGELYEIAVYSPDESGDYLSYDYLTLKLVKKVS